MVKIKKDIVYAFIDSQNLNLGTSKDLYKHGILVYKGWKLDFKKFYRYLADKFHITKAILFIGYIDQYEPMYRRLKSFGYNLVFKPTVKDDQGKPKGNIDAEVVLYSSAIEYKNYNKAVVVAGDGDYYCLYKYLIENNKLLKIIIPNEKSESTLLKEFQKYKVFIQFDKNKLEYLESKKVIKSGRRRS